jgi:PLP dependent protein
MNIKNNIEEIKRLLPPTCTLVVVSKTQPPDKILEAYHTGHRIFGENKVQELCAKAEALPPDIEWHLIGHLQTNKVKYIIPFVSLIHAVDSLKLLREIDKQARKVNRTIKCLLQLHIAEEETKFGLSEAETLDLLQHGDLESFTGIEVIGLMGMATFSDNADQVRKEFKGLKHFYNRVAGMKLPKNVSMKELSMGMSNDYKIAIEEGSTLVRLGTIIFGERN